MDAETSAVWFGRTRIAYGIRRSRRRATVSIAVDPHDGVLLTAPAAAPIERLDRVVHRKARWILDRLGRQTHLETLPPREFVSGESFRYLGCQYRLRVLSRSDAGVRLRAGYLEVPAPLDGGERSRRVRALLSKWFRAHAALRLPERGALWSQRLHMPAPGVVIRDQQKRWGSCDARGIVRFNWRIIQAPMGLVDYVVVHELVHLGEENHTRAFWARIGRVMPDYERRREALRRLGPALVW